MSNIEQSFQSGKAQAETECQAERAVQAVQDTVGSTVDHAGAAADSAQQQAHRAADAVQEAGEHAAQAAQGAVDAVKDAATSGH
ncbi:hypothetical protein EJB05_25518 [Eragrostis curvula]|uniref:Uncharacterized protein n=1 Tax=Eragrostis curvula TaxID=38414 RepID=A0A5J9VC66_9POAL|nr:hypothetical protein EJB05_25506 [Eragrostis curvula]TVU33685.1 hypothetical protein EJB05_25518 [Eragrostis curvula]